MSVNEGHIKVSIPTTAVGSGLLEAHTKIVYLSPVETQRRKPPTGAGVGFKCPQTIRVYKDKWGESNLGINDENDTAFLINVGDNEMVLSVNMDCKYLQERIKLNPEKKVFYESQWEIFCLFFWGGLADEENKVEIQRLYNKSFIAVFPFIETVLTMQVG